MGPATKAQTVFNASGFLLAPLPILLMWVDLEQEYQYLMLLLFFVLLPLARLLWPIDISDELNADQTPWALQLMLRWLPGFFAVVWLFSALLLPFGAGFEQKNGVQIATQWICVWIAASLALPVSHELVHRPASGSLLGRLVGASIGLFFFLEEHRMHHIKSGKGHDPDCADQFENVYAFAGRTGVESFWSAWDYEVAQQSRQRRSAWGNRIFWTGAATASFGGLWLWVHGLAGLFFYASLCLGVFFSLRVITYIQHWGLRETSLKTGGPGVAWVSTCIFQSWLIFNLALHESHHSHPGRPYWSLRAGPADLKLPVTYPMAFLAVLIPPLYRRLMAPRLALWLDGASKGRLVDQPESCVI